MVSTQKKIRDLRRILKKLIPTTNGQPDKEHEADDGRFEEIQNIQHRIDELEAAKESNKLREVKRKHENKYHMVKFFERRKVTRKLRKVIALLNSTKSEINENEIKSLRDQQLSLEDDLTYILYYPITMKYVALFASSERKVDSNEREESDGDADEGEEELYRAKNMKLMARARELARLARISDQENNQRDKVTHAINVELRGKRGREKGSPTGSNFISKGEVDTHDRNELIQSESRKKRNRKDDKILENSSKKPKNEKNEAPVLKNNESGRTEAPEDIDDDFFLQNGEEVNEKDLSYKTLRPSSSFQQIKQAVNTRKFQHHKRFAAKTSNFKKF